MSISSVDLQYLPESLSSASMLVLSLKELPIPFFVLSSIDFSPSRSRSGSALKTLTVAPPLLVEIRPSLSRVSVLRTILGIDRRCQI